MKRFILSILFVLFACIGFAQPMGFANPEFRNEPTPQFRTFARRGVPSNTVHFRGWGGMFNFVERGFEPVFNLNTPKLNQVRVYISEIPAFEQQFSHKRNEVVTFEIPDTAGTTLLRFYGISETIEFLKIIKTTMEEIAAKDKLTNKQNAAYVKAIKKTMPSTAYFWDDYAGFNNKIEPIIVYNGKGSEPMIVLEGISYCRIKFKDLSTIIDPGFSGDGNIKCEIQLPFNGIDEVTRMIERLNFNINMPRQPQFNMPQRVGFIPRRRR